MATHSTGAPLGTTYRTAAPRTLPQHRMYVAGDPIITARGTLTVSGVETRGTARIIVADDPQRPGFSFWFGEHDVILDRL